MERISRWANKITIVAFATLALTVTLPNSLSAQEGGQPASDTMQPEPGMKTPAPVDTTKAAIETSNDTMKTTQATPADTAAKPAPAKQPEAKPKTEEPVDPKAPYKNVQLAPGDKPRVVMETTFGKIVLELWPEVAPNHVKSFVHLVRSGFYDSLTIHRVSPGFVIQGGDPAGNGSGGPGYTVPAEFSPALKHEDGILSMARTPDPNSAGSQFFIMLGKAPSLDGQYSIFGKVVEGLDVVHKIEKTPVQRERPLTPVIMTRVYLEPKA